MTLPTATKTWTISANNRIVYTSLAVTQQKYLHGIKTFLLAHGWTCKGSASAGTGAMDGVDRWTVTTDVTPRATAMGASCGWWCGTDANGSDLLLAWVGASDDVAMIRFSPGGHMSTTCDSGPIRGSVNGAGKTWTRSLSDIVGVAIGTQSFLLHDGFVNGQSVIWTGWINAGNNITATLTTLTATVMTASGAGGMVTETNDGVRVVGASANPTFCPSAYDSYSITDGTALGQSTIGATASGDRVYHMWVDSTSKLFRCAIGRAGSCINVWGLELFNYSAGSTTTCSPAVWGFMYTRGGCVAAQLEGIYGVGTSASGGVAAVSVGGVANVAFIGGGITNFAAPVLLGATALNLNDAGRALVPLHFLGMITSNTNMAGRLGVSYDHWMGYVPAADMDVYTGSTLIHVSNQLVWPWDGATVGTYT